VTVAGTCLVYLANRHAAYRETLNGINHKRNTEKDKTKKSLDIRKVAKGMLNIESQKSQREAAVVLEIAIETIKSHRHNNNSSENSKCVGCVPNSWLWTWPIRRTQILMKNANRKQWRKQLWQRRQWLLLPFLLLSAHLPRPFQRQSVQNGRKQWCRRLHR
jgi:hypothetical protein